MMLAHPPFERQEIDMKVIMATSNENKVREIRQMLEGSDLEIISLKEAGVHAEIEENGTTFAENARIKAETVRDLTGQIAIADDSGLEIDYLNGQPGIYSSRFMGTDTPYPKKNQAILDLLKEVPEEKRSARFVCAMAIAWPDRECDIFEGVMEGRIAFRIAGEGGFGYDPIFYLPEYGCTSAQLTSDEKNAVSHRGKALRQAAAVLRSVL